MALVLPRLSVLAPAVSTVRVPLVGLMVELAPRVRVVVDPRESELLVVRVERDEAVMVVPDNTRLEPEVVNAATPLGASIMFPVLLPPRVSVWLSYVCTLPDESIDNAGPPAVCAEIEAVGVPVFTLMNANLAEVVEVAPSKRSCVVILSNILPLFWSNGDPPFPVGNIPVTSLDARLTAEEDNTPEELEWSIPVPNADRVIVPEEVNPVSPVRVPVATRLEPLVINAVTPLGARAIFPVELLPRVRVWLFVVPTVPLALW